MNIEDNKNKNNNTVDSLSVGDNRFIYMLKDENNKPICCWTGSPEDNKGAFDEQTFQRYMGERDFGKAKEYLHNYRFYDLNEQKKYNQLEKKAEIDQIRQANIYAIAEKEGNKTPLDFYYAFNANNLSSLRYKTDEKGNKVRMGLQEFKETQPEAYSFYTTKSAVCGLTPQQYDSVRTHKIRFPYAQHGIGVSNGTGIESYYGALGLSENELKERGVSVTRDNKGDVILEFDSSNALSDKLFAYLPTRNLYANQVNISSYDMDGNKIQPDYINNSRYATKSAPFTGIGSIGLGDMILTSITNYPNVGIIGDDNLNKYYNTYQTFQLKSLQEHIQDCNGIFTSTENKLDNNISPIISSTKIIPYINENMYKAKQEASKLGDYSKLQNVIDTERQNLLKSLNTLEFQEVTILSNAFNDLDDANTSSNLNFIKDSKQKEQLETYLRSNVANKNISNSDISISLDENGTAGLLITLPSFMLSNKGITDLNQPYLKDFNERSVQIRILDSKLNESIQSMIDNNPKYQAHITDMQLTHYGEPKLLYDDSYVKFDKEEGSYKILKKGTKDWLDATKDEVIEKLEKDWLMNRALDLKFNENYITADGKLNEPSFINNSYDDVINLCFSLYANDSDFVFKDQFNNPISKEDILNVDNLDKNRYSGKVYSLMEMINEIYANVINDASFYFPKTKTTY